MFGFRGKFLVKSILIILVSWACLSFSHYKFQEHEFAVSRQESKALSENIILQSVQSVSNKLEIIALNLINRYYAQSNSNSQNHEERFIQALDSTWETLRRIDRAYNISYYNSEGTLIKKYHHNLIFDSAELPSTLEDSYMKKAINNANGFSYVSCQSFCYLHHLNSISKFSDRDGYIQVSLPAENFLFSFNSLTGQDIFIMSKQENDNFPSIVSDNESYYLSYTSNYENLHVLDELTNTENTKDRHVIHQDDQQYEISILAPEKYELNKYMRFILYANISDQYKIFFNSSWIFSGYTLLIITIALILFYFTLNKIFRHHHDLRQILPLIGKRDFSQARKQLDKYLNVKQDELTSVFFVTEELNSDLEQLYKDIELTNSKLQIALNDSEQKRDYITSILNTAESIIITCDKNHRIQSCNQYAQELLSKNSEPIIGQSILNYVPVKPEHIDKIQALIISDDIDTCIQFQSQLNATDQSIINISVHCRLILALDQYLFMAYDVTENVIKEQKIRHLAEIDQLSGLLNLNQYWQQSQQLIDRLSSSKNNLKHGKKLGMIYVDINQFKIINDRWGHQFGNFLLRALGRIISHSLEPTQGIASRAGGDEYMITIIEDNSDAIVNYANHLEQTIRNHVFEDDNIRTKMTVAIGISIFPDHSESLEKLATYADAAMYENKNLHLEKVRLYDGKETLITEKQHANKWSQEIREIIYNKEIEGFLQPVVHTSNFAVAHYEVLARRSHHADELNIEQLIRQSERVFLIPMIDQLVMENVLQRIADYDTNINLLFNISLITLASEGYAENLMALLNKYNIPPKHITLEITESQEIKDFKFIQKLITDIKKYGISFALDDYGHGYTSLTYLTKLPIDFLKLDISLISEIDRKTSTLEVVKSIVGLCNKFSIDVIAEGVERQSQINILQDLEVKYLQGFYFSKPLPCEDIIKAIKEQ